MNKKPEYLWDEKDGIATCIIYYKDESFWGFATCHPDDKDMMTKYTGQRLAEIRATIQLLKHIKKNELKPKLAALKQFYYSINRSKQYNKKSYESRMLYRQIQNLTFDLDAINEEIVALEETLQSYIKGKEEIYTFLRAQRVQDKDN